MNDRRGNSATAAKRSPTLGGEAGPSIISMIGFVAASVAVTILVFFGIGYVFGRLFL